MATTIEVSQKDITDADTFLGEYIQEAKPTGDFSPGTALRDLAVGAIANVFAFLRAEIATSRSMQSIRQIENLPNSDDRDEAADAILSNLFVTRNPGRQAHVQTTLHFSKASDVTVAVTTRFFRTTSLAFLSDTDSTITIPAAQLTPTFNSDGSVKDYTVVLAMKAAAAGTGYNQTAGRFIGADVFNPFFLYAEHTVDIHDGKDIQSTSEMITDAPDALSTRNLVNQKSISAVLKSTFSDLSRIFVVGMGDPEMVRDLTEDYGASLRLHTGGMYDAFVDLPRTVANETLTVGAAYARPDGVISVFRDPVTVTPFAGIVPGMVLGIAAGLPDSPRNYLITGVGDDYVEVWDRIPFSHATDEDDVPVGLSYTIGTTGPGFNDVVALRTTGETSRKEKRTLSVMLTGQPQYRINDVSLIDGATTTQLGPRVNRAPVELEYQIVTVNPRYGQSGKAVTLVVLAADNPSLPVDPTTASLAVSYDTLTDYSLVQGTLVEAFTRTICANTLSKGFHPVYISAAITYDVANGTSSDMVPTPAQVQAAVVQLINSFPSTDALSCSYISTYLTRKFPFSGIYPITLYYTLMAPDGQFWQYQTQDVVRVIPDSNHTAQVINGLSLRVPIDNAGLPPTTGNAAAIAAANILVQGQLNAMGVSDRGVRYFADSSDITCNPR